MLEVNYEKVQSARLLFDGAVEQPVEGDCTLPEYMPEIQRIVKCITVPSITQKLASGSRVTVSGFVMATVIYESSERTVHSAMQRLAFSKSVELASPVPEWSFISASGSMQYLNCRASSARRLDFRGAMSINLRVVGQHEQSVATEAVGGGIELLTENAVEKRLIGGSGKRFTVEDVFPASGELKVVYSCAEAVVRDCTLFDGSVSVAGSVEVLVLLLEQNKIAEKRFSMPFNQIVDTAVFGAGDAYGIAEAHIISVLVEPQFGEDGGLVVSVGASLDAAVVERRELSFVADAYSTEYATAAERGEYNLLSELVKINEPIEGEQSFSYTAQDAQLEAALLMPSGFMAQDGGTTLNATLTVFLRMPDESLESAEFSFSHRVLDEEYSVGDTREWTALFKKCAAVLSGGTLKLSFSGELFGSAAVYRKIGGIKELSLDETAKKQKSDLALCIYYAGEGESAFEIAKAHSAPAKRLMQENKLDGDTLNERRMLLIPMV